jgi:hypothetical protein
MLVVGQITPNNANVGLANTGSLQVWGGAYISGNTTIGRQATTEQVYVQGNSNLLTYSQNLENAAWGKVTSFVRFGPSANTFAPDGTNTASQLINNTGGLDSGYAGQDVVTLNTNTPYTFSVFLKQGNATFAQVNMYAANGGLNDALANVNFNTGTVAASGTNLINSTFVPVGGGWYRVSITLNSLNQRQFINRIYASGFSGLLGQFSYFWGAQLEPGITPSAYANTSSGNIVKANNNLFVMGNTYIYSSNSSVSNTTGALVVGGGVGITGNLFMSAANNYFTTTTESSYRLGWTDNYFQRSNLFGGMNVQGTYFNLDTTTFLAANRNFIVRGIISNDTGNNTVLFAGSSPVRLQNTAASTSNTTGSLIVGGGIGVSGNIYVGGTNAGVNGIYTDVLRYAANGLPWVMNAGGGGGGGISASGYLANTLIYSNSAGFISNTRPLSFYEANNTIVTSNYRANGNVILGNTATSNTATIQFNATLNTLDFLFS